MALCLEVVSGALQVAAIQPTSMAECAGPVVMSAAEYVGVSIVPTFSMVFAIPPTADLTAMWMAGFSLPAIGIMVAWGAAKVVDMFH